MAEHNDSQIGFRVREEADKTSFQEALEQQRHIANATVFFQSVMDALIAVSKRNEVVEWPVELVTKKKK